MGGSPTSQTTAQQQTQLESSQQQQQFDSQLMSIFQKQYATQSGTLNYLQGQLKPIIAQSEAGQGMSDAALNAMRTSATDQLSSQFQGAQAALNQNETSQMGGTNVLPSGTQGQLEAGLLTNEAQQKASTQNQITQYNQSLATSNLWNSFNVMSGTAAQMNPLGYASGATSGTGAVASGSSAQGSLQNSINSSYGSGLFGSLATGLGNGAGDTLGGMI